jgi:hypothetical protein
MTGSEMIIERKVHMSGACLKAKTPAGSHDLVVPGRPADVGLFPGQRGAESDRHHRAASHIHGESDKDVTAESHLLKQEEEIFTYIGCSRN